MRWRRGCARRRRSKTPASQGDGRPPRLGVVEEMDGAPQRETDVLVRLAREGRVDPGDDAPLLAVVLDDEVDEHLRAEVLDDADSRGDRPLVADVDRLWAEAHRQASAAQCLP